MPQASLPRTTNLFRFEEVQRLVAAAGDGRHDVPYEDLDAKSAQGSGPYRRPIEQTRTFYRKDDLSGPLPLAAIEPLALPDQSYTLGFTPGLLAVLGAKISPADATTLLEGAEGRYQDLDGDGRLWVPSGRVFFSTDADHPDAVFARAHRYLPQGARDPFGNISRLAHDGYELLVARTIDALGNTVTAEYDYRVLEPTEVTDPNGNRTAAAFDVLGLLVATAVMGKAQEPDNNPRGLAAKCGASHRPIPNQWLRRRSTRASRCCSARHKPNRLRPESVRTLADRRLPPRGVRTACRGLAARPTSRIKVGFLAPTIPVADQEKIAAEPAVEPPASRGPALGRQRWTIFSNKEAGRQYEPFFTALTSSSPSARRQPDALLRSGDTRDRTLPRSREKSCSIVAPGDVDANDPVGGPAADSDVASWFARPDPATIR